MSKTRRHQADRKDGRTVNEMPADSEVSYVYAENTSCNLATCFPHLIGKKARVPGKPEDGLCEVRGYIYRSMTFECVIPHHGYDERVLISVQDIVEMLVDKIDTPDEELTFSERGLLESVADRKLEEI